MATSDIHPPRLEGSMVALVTPMFPDGTLDFESLKKLIDWHVAEGTKAIVVVGTSGESPTVNMTEHAEIIEVAVKHADKRIPVIAGVGGNSTSEAIELSQYAYDVGADAGLSVVPYYNRPTQEGLYQHFKKIAETVPLPTLLYNVPGRTVADMSNETVVRLAQVPGIIGTKEATGDMARLGALLRDLPESFTVVSGDDATAAALILLGGKGNISVTANIAPAMMSALCQAALDGDLPAVRKYNALLADLNQLLFIEANPIPVKWALAEMGRIQLGYRLPMTPLSEVYHERLRTALREAGLLA